MYRTSDGGAFICRITRTCDCVMKFHHCKHGRARTHRTHRTHAPPIAHRRRPSVSYKGGPYRHSPSFLDDLHASPPQHRRRHRTRRRLELVAKRRPRSTRMKAPATRGDRTCGRCGSAVPLSSAEPVLVFLGLTFFALCALSTTFRAFHDPNTPPLLAAGSITDFRSPTTTSRLLPRTQ